MRARWLGPLLVLSAAPGCKLTPDYERPPLDLPDAWRQDPGPGASIANLTWWEVFGDPRLQELIEIALNENKDLGIALARIAEARSSVVISRADQFPFLDIFTGASRGRQSRIEVPGAARGDRFEVAADLSYEVDLWYRFARATEAARADLLATEAA